MPPRKKRCQPSRKAQLLFQQEPLEGPKHHYGSPQRPITHTRQVSSKPIDHNTITSWVGHGILTLTFALLGFSEFWPFCPWNYGLWRFMGAGTRRQCILSVISHLPWCIFFSKSKLKRRLVVFGVFPPRFLLKEFSIKVSLPSSLVKKPDKWQNE